MHRGVRPHFIFRVLDSGVEPGSSGNLSFPIIRVRTSMSAPFSGFQNLENSKQKDYIARGHRDNVYSREEEHFLKLRFGVFEKYIFGTRVEFRLIER